MSRSIPNEVINFKHDMPIELFTKNAATFSMGDKYDSNEFRNDYWHQLICHHSNNVSRDEIVQAYYKKLGGQDEPCNIVAYKRGEYEDKFLFLSNNNVPRKLFADGLHFVMNFVKVLKVDYTIRANVARIEEGHISIRKAIERALNMEFLKCAILPNVGRVLVLNKFEKHNEFQREITLNLSTKADLKMLLCIIIKDIDRFRTIQGIKLRYNNIVSLKPFEMYSAIKCEFALVDLSHNQISSRRQFSYLKGIVIKDLRIEANPICEKKTQIEVRELISDILPNIAQVDGVLADSRDPRRLPEMAKYQKDMGEPNLCEGVEVEDVICSQTYEEIKRSRMWHMITIPHNGSFTKAKILEAFFTVLDQNLPPIYPCYYKIGSNEDRFLVHSCADHLVYLTCRLNRNLQIGNKSIKIKIHLYVSHLIENTVKPPDEIIQAATSKFNVMDKSLDLSDFKSSELFRDFETSLGCWRVRQNVLNHCSRKYLNGIVSLDLSKNGIFSTKGLDPLRLLQNLRILNLGMNRLPTVDCLKDIPKLEIAELVLDDNPLCALYKLPDQYIRDVKKVFPYLTKLDDMVLKDIRMNIQSKQNYLCDVHGHDFVEQFISSYFRQFQKNERESLKNYYHPNAIFSISSHLRTSSADPWQKRHLAMFKEYSRNLLLNEEDCELKVFCGREEIANVLEKIPHFDHDFYSLKTDLLKFTPTSVILVVNGIFRFEATHFDESDIFLSFTRTFVFTGTNQTNATSFTFPVQYEITNEVFHVTFATSSQARTAFQIKSPEDDLVKASKKLSDMEKDAMILLLQEYCPNLDRKACKKLYKRRHWNLLKTLELYLEENEKIKAEPMDQS